LRAEQRLRLIGTQGVPNYFGSQRFGREGGNLVRVAEMFDGRGRKPGREQRSLLLSAARAQLFNRVLQTRVEDANWNQALDGDVMALSGSQRQFMFDPDDATIAPRLAELDIHPTGPLCGRHSRALEAQSQAGRLEEQALAGHGDWIDGLQRFGLEADRRALRLAVTDLDWRWEGDVLELRFGLVSGAYATAVLREIVREQAPA
jgi:tRNA pseudouridine13 synthase